MLPKTTGLVGIVMLGVILPCSTNAQYGNPYNPGYGQPQSYANQPSQLEIEAYLGRQQVHGVRPSYAAYLAVRTHGDSAKAIINRFGDDGLAALGSVSRISANALRDLIPELKQIRQIYPLLRLIAQHQEPDRLVELLEIYRQDLASSPIVEVLLKKPDAVLALGPLVRMPEIVALNQDMQSPPTLFARTGAWFESFRAPASDGDREARSKQIADALLIGFVGVVFAAVIWQARKRLKGSGGGSKARASTPLPRIENSSGRPKPAFMVQRDRNNGN